jgi:DNA replication protein DnaC
MSQATVSSLVEKMKSSGRYTEISDDEYKRLQCEQFSKLAAQTAANFKPDLSRIGLHESELNLAWNKVSPAISDGKKAVDAVQPAYERGWGMVFLWGSYGQAKILVATAHREGKKAAYANVSSVLDDIRLAFDEREAKTTELLRRMDFWISRDVLFLDELDKSNDTPWAQERMFQLLDQRYTRAIREEALTVIASNSKVDALDGYLASRLKDKRLGPVVYLNGQDGRQVMPEGWKF